jgi:hypothetical protein
MSTPGKAAVLPGAEFAAIGLRHQLVAKADAENGLIDLNEIFAIARPVHGRAAAEHQAVRLLIEYVVY